MYGIAAIMLGILAVLVLIPSYLALFSGSKQAPLSYTTNVGVQQRVDQSVISRAAAYTDTLYPIIAASSSMDAAISAVLVARPTVVHLDDISYTGGLITVMGVAPDAPALENYRGALTRSTVFKTVAIPVNALVGANDGRFTISLSGDF